MHRLYVFLLAITGVLLHACSPDLPEKNICPFSSVRRYFTGWCGIPFTWDSWLHFGRLPWWLSGISFLQSLQQRTCLLASISRNATLFLSMVRFTLPTRNRYLWLFQCLPNEIHTNRRKLTYRKVGWLWSSISQNSKSTNCIYNQNSWLDQVRSSEPVKIISHLE